MLTDKEVEKIIEGGADKSSDEDFDRLVEWVLEEEERVIAASSKTIWANPYLNQDQDTHQ